MSDQIQVSHILLMYDGSLRSTATRSQDEAKQKIGEIKAEIDGGGDFSEAAQANSDCPSSAQGGDLGSFRKGTMVPEFEAVAFDEDVPLGKLQGPVKTQFGYHVIKVVKRGVSTDGDGE